MLLTFHSEGLAKKRQTFYFFRINQDDVTEFKHQLAHLIPLITTAGHARKFRSDIRQAKQTAAQTGRQTGLLDNSAVNIAFSQTGLNVVSTTIKYTFISLI